MPSSGAPLKELHQEELTPSQIVGELNRYVVGQAAAKKAVAIAMRNRWRRRQLSDALRNEVTPHNILMIGPTGVGKTELARRLAKLANAPFIKVEATKFTQIGYVGRDVESIIRDLIETAINMVRERTRIQVREKAEAAAEERILVALVGENASPESRKKFYDKFKNNQLNDSEVEISVADTKQTHTLDMPMMDFPGGQMGVFNLGEMLSKSMGGPQHRNVRMKVHEAYELVLKEETEKLLDKDLIVREAIKATENDGIVFLDEIDKIAGGSQIKGDVSREGVQRDLLPLVEGTIVSTKYGPIDTTHILFIASGAFHISKPSDMLPELQGRFPIRVELSPLSEDDMVSILRDPEHSLTKQYHALLATEKVHIEFTENGIKKIAHIASELNREVENIGARRLHTVMEKLLEELNYSASDSQGMNVLIDEEYVDKNLQTLTRSHDLSKFVL